MRRSVRWTLFASVWRRSRSFVAACGGSDNEQQQSSGGGGSDHGRHRDQGGQEGRHAHATSPPLTSTTSTRARRTTRSATWSQYADEPHALLVQARRLGQAGAGPRRRASREISDDNKTITVKHQEGRQVRAAGQPRGQDRRTSSTRSSAPSPSNVPSGYAGRTSARIVGAPTKPTTGDQADLGHQTPDDTHDRLQAQDGRARRSSSQALVMPITVPVPEEYAEKFDAKTPSTYDQHVASTGPYMVKNDADGQARPATSRASRSTSSATRTGTSRPTSGPPTWTRSTIEEGNDDLTVGLAPRAAAATDSMCCDAGSPPAPVLKQAVQQQQGPGAVSCRPAARATSR